MKALINFLKLLSLFAILSLFQACSSNDDSPSGGNNDPEIELSLSDIVGRWGIIRVTEQGGSPETLVPCKNTLEIQANGDLLYVEADAGEWEEGHASFNSADSILTVTFGGQTETFKLLSVSETGFELEFTENDGGTVVVGSDEYVKLEGSDCASITTAEIATKWSVDEIDFKEYEIEDGDDLGTLIDTDVQENIPYNKFTLEFSSDGSFIMIDLINEFDFEMGTYENLDDHNYVLSFDDEGLDDETLAHVLTRTDDFVTLMLAEYNDNDDRRVVTELVIGENDGSEPTISESDLDGKWSASNVTERAFLEGQLIDEHVLSDIPHNQLTLEFYVDSEEIQLIDLVQEIEHVLGEFTLLDGSNLLLGLGDEDEEENLELFHILSADNGELTLISYDIRDNDGVGGEANTDHDELEYDLREFELSLNKNTGDEPGIDEDELLGEWVLTEVESFDLNSPSDDGPQVGMVLAFINDGSGEISSGGDIVTTFDFELIDMSNVLVEFDDEEEGFTIFHLIEYSSDVLEIILFEPAREGDGEGQDEPEGGATHRLVIERQGG